MARYVSSQLLLVVVCICSVVWLPSTRLSAAQELELYDLEARLPYDVPYAHRMLSLSGAAYCPSSTIAEWKCSFCSQVDEFKIYGVNYNATTDMLSFVGYDGATNTVVVSFRGTNPLSIKDWLADLNFFMTPFGSGNDCEKCQVHRGFLAAYQSIRDRTLEWMLKAKSQFPDAKIAVTGHSLGGALAMVAAMDFHLYANTTADLFYTYGQPRVGNSAFTDLFKRTFNDSTMYRLTHGLDPGKQTQVRLAIGASWVKEYNSGTIAPGWQGKKALELHVRTSACCSEGIIPMSYSGLFD